MFRFHIVITDRVTGSTVVNRLSDSFSFVVRHRRRPDLPTHEIIADEYDSEESEEIEE